jgi:hypothetical protein
MLCVQGSSAIACEDIYHCQIQFCSFRTPLYAVLIGSEDISEGLPEFYDQIPDNYITHPIQMLPRYYNFLKKMRNPQENYDFLLELKSG